MSTTTPSIKFTFTPTATFTPEIISNPIPGFRVDWHTEAPDCDIETLVTKKRITAVEIFGGVPPYIITFRQHGRIIATRSSPVDGWAEFTNPVIVDKGEYVHVTISFRKANQEFTWDDDLFYKQIDAECQTK
jgi:hypothetical protein